MLSIYYFIFRRNFLTSTIYPLACPHPSSNTKQQFVKHFQKYVSSSTTLIQRIYIASTSTAAPTSTPTSASLHTQLSWPVDTTCDTTIETVATKRRRTCSQQCDATCVDNAPSCRIVASHSIHPPQSYRKPFNHHAPLYSYMHWLVDRTLIAATVA